jgi:acyl carrier protein
LAATVIQVILVDAVLNFGAVSSATIFTIYRKVAFQRHSMATITDRIRSILNQHAKLPVDASTLTDGADLYAVGLSSFATVQLMLALEEEFDVELPDRLLNRRSFESIAAIAGVIDAVGGARALG